MVKNITENLSKYIVLFLLCIASNISNASDKEQLLKIQQYLGSLKYIAANFTQIDSNNNTQYGKFLLSRPGKLRWEYRYPKEINIIFNGNRIFYHDKELDQKSEYEIQDSLLYFLISPNINFLSKSSAYYVQSFSNKDQVFILTIKHKYDSKDETLIIALQKKPLKLISIELKEKLRIFIDSIICYKALDKNLFRF